MGLGRPPPFLNPRYALRDDTRASMCLALLDGRAWTAAELARHAGVAAHPCQSLAAGVVSA